MKVGVIVPQGWTGEYDGWEPGDAWARTVKVAKQAEELGFESIWLFDHFHTVPEPSDEITFEAFTSLTALAVETHRVRLGHIVLCASYRNPALVAKMLATLDVISVGRVELGIGAGWKRDEWTAYGYGFPDTKERLAALHEALEIITRMWDSGHATFEGRIFSVRDAINMPKPLQRRGIPIMVGGNGQNVTWRIAARFADEINLDGMSVDEAREALPIIRQRCEEIGRDPASLKVSAHIWRKDPERNSREPLSGILTGFRELGLSRVMTLLPGLETSDEVLEEFAEAAQEAGAEMLVPARV